jgi:SprT protein
MQKQDILKAYEEVYNKACELFPEYRSFPKPTVKFTTRGTSAGKAGFTFRDNSNFLQFNTAIANNAGEDFLNTIQHEVAHLVSYCLYRKRFLMEKIQAHGTEFKRIHKMLGGTGERTHNYSIEGVTGIQQRHKWKCDCRTYEVSTRKNNIMLQKMSYGAVYRCGSCKVPVVKV